MDFIVGYRAAQTNDNGGSSCLQKHIHNFFSPLDSALDEGDASGVLFPPPLGPPALCEVEEWHHICLMLIHRPLARGWSVLENVKKPLSAISEITIDVFYDKLRR